jgi:hypothetical protein
LGDLKKRKWVYVMKPTTYEIVCDKCGGPNIAWSEFEGLVWCFDCKIDTRGSDGIFDGPIPLEIAKMFGISFDRFYLKNKSIIKMEIVGNKLIWKKVNK